MEIYLSKCNLNDFDSFYFLKCDEENIYWTGHKSKPEKQNLEKWFNEQLQRKDRIIFLAKDLINDEVVGYLYLDIVGDSKNIIETGHGVHSKFKGNGLGTKIISLAIQYTKENLHYIDKIDGWILENNIGSIQNVLRNGYSQTDETKKVFVESTNKEEFMRKYTYKIER
jgi:RimJ/RimL family protein N-acetyltransferase